ncbi:zinc-ribbon domain-containing protein, partial [Pelagibacteraceae bacterium]|nr:zinc-ribbon domain-containing protein [Pelagibacteraceae bacterium]
MILSCNSCEKKFVVPDQAISNAGRTVQCGSCGNKWKQFPIKNEVKLTTVDDNLKIRKTANLSKTYKRKKKRAKKTREIDLYSPEYLEKK